MIRNIEVINEKMSELVVKYMGMGYVINSGSMHGSDGTARVDLHKGKHFIRVFVERISAYSYFENEPSNIRWARNDVYVVQVGEQNMENKRFLEDDIVWAKNLNILEKYPFYMVNYGYRNMAFTEDLNEAIFCNDKRHSRDKCRGYDDNERHTWTDYKHLSIGLSLVKRQPRTKSITLKNMDSVEKINSSYNRHGYRVHYRANNGDKKSIAYYLTEKY